MPGYLSPPAWDEETLKADRREAVAAFVAERSAEGGERYRTAFAKNLVEVQSLFVASNDLRDFGSGDVLSAQPKLSGVARYLCGPPISSDDLDTIAGARLAARSRLSLADAQRVEHVIEASVDRDRFPWLYDIPWRSPTDTEREIGLKWTAGLKAAQEVATGRRSEFCETETRVAGSKCDVAIGLMDGRLLLCECKVSNSGVNSVKRLNRECCEKAATWRSAFGSQAITAAVLAGVYELRNLLDAQRGASPVAIFWEHRLDRLADFITHAK